MSNKPTSILWPLEPHTAGKHALLREYLKAWLAIVGKGRMPLQLIDGFAGPGEYAGGEFGSPLIMLHEVVTAGPPAGGAVALHFLEENGKRAANLRALIATTFPKLPAFITYDVQQARFTDIAQLPAVQRGSLAPAFVMVDPFGVSHTPMQLLGMLLKSRSSELFVSLMLNDVARHGELPSWSARLDALFGATGWRSAMTMPTNEMKRFALLELYIEQLRAHGAKYVLTFELWQEGTYKYNIVFATTHPSGSVAMKEAMWKALKSDIYIAPRHQPGQLQLAMDTGGVRRQPSRELEIFLRVEFRGQTAGVERLETYMVSDEQPFAPSHLREALKRLEENGQLSVAIPAGMTRRRGTFPAGRGLQLSFSA